MADILQNLVARTNVSLFRPYSPHVVSCAVEVGRKGGAGPATHPATPSFTFVGRWVEVGRLSLGLFVFVFEVDGFYLERELGLMPCCLVHWCRLGLRPLSSARLLLLMFAEELLLLLLPAPPSFP